LAPEESPENSEKEIKIRYFREDNEIKGEIQKPKGIKIVNEEEFIPRIPIPQKELFLYYIPFYFAISSFGDIFLPNSIFLNLGIYNFDPKLSKKPVLPLEVRWLREDGSNLALVMREILRDPQERKRFLRLVRYALPFIEEVDVARFLDQSLVFTLKENYSKESMPGFFVSDGTAHILALILALYFGERNIVIIEEPERNIHPSLIYKIVGMMKDASRYKQIIATTHNPEMVRHAGIEPLLLFYRDKNGFSKVKRPADKEDIRKFLEETMGLEELYVQNLLEVF
ncbi:MAG: AAA family ATPase, partial [bacterium]